MMRRKEYDLFVVVVNVEGVKEERVEWVYTESESGFVLTAK